MESSSGVSKHASIHLQEETLCTERSLLVCYACNTAVSFVMLNTPHGQTRNTVLMELIRAVQDRMLFYLDPFFLFFLKIEIVEEHHLCANSDLTFFSPG